MRGLVLLRVGLARAFGFEDVALILESVSAFLSFDLAETLFPGVVQRGGDACFTLYERGFHLLLLFDCVGVCRVGFALSARFLGGHFSLKLHAQFV